MHQPFMKSYFDDLIPVLDFSKEILLRSEAIAKLASQITERHNCSSFDRGRIRDQLLQKNQGPSFAGRTRKVQYLFIQTTCYVTLSIRA